MGVRLATVNDSNEILKIYGQYINTAITFEYALPSEEEFRERVKSIISQYPYLVYEEESKIIGYAHASRYKERTAYQWGAELSIYIDSNFTSKGIGKVLCLTLIELLKLQEVRTVYGCVTLPNEKSEKLQISLGFKKVGILHNAGYKCDKWRDVAWFEKVIATCDKNPKDFISISKIPEDKILKILEAD
ncbi:N-acetyltransferase [Clostridium saudiense]|nr:N-acetyltransferase [Clostridium saudiense]